MSTPATILIVDDEAQNRKLLEALLKPEGYQTLCAANGAEALAAVALHLPDLILLDIMMPGMDGYQVTKLLKANPNTAHIPVVMVTAQSDRNARLTGLNAGAEEFLTKPVDRAELWLRVRNLLRLKAFNDFLKNHSQILEQQVRARTADLQRFRSAMDATCDAIFLTNRSTMRFIEVNATACQMFGYTREEFFALGPHQLAGDSREHLESIYDALIGGHAANDLLEMQMLRKDGSTIEVELHRQVQRFGAEWIVVSVMHDIGERKQAEQRLHQLAHYDALTGLPNRAWLNETLKRTLSLPLESGSAVAVICMDLDNFKNVNDTLGHALGDALLRQVSQRLIQCIGIRDTVGRMGGDEFALVVCSQDGVQGAANLANKIREALRARFDLSGNEVTVTASIGIALHPADASDPETLLKFADTAMYRAKQAGRDAFRFFTTQMNTEVMARLELESALRKAVENNEFLLYYQPKVQLNSGCIIGLEALIRWQRPGHGLVSPQHFISVLEETGLIVPVGSWVIATACQQIASWIRLGIGPVQISVNVAARQLVEGDLERDVLKALRDNDISGDQLELELTESALLANTEHTILSLKNLKNHGVQISLDDFGTGYSSLAYLRRFPIDKLKIDMAFIRDVTSNPDAAAIVMAIISMAHKLKLEVVAEGVETAAQLSTLRRKGCDQIQGYFFSVPLPVAEVETILREEKHLPSPETDPELPRKTLLLVDDEAPVLSALQRVLRQDGYQILAARSAAEGFELLAQHKVQVILCDQRMPTMNGSEFLDKVKALFPDTLRIILLGYTDLATLTDAINCGAIYRFYTKPWDNKILRDNIGEAFQHHARLNGNFTHASPQ